MKLMQADGTTITLTLTIRELETVNNALNEICNGLDIPGFETRVGARRDEVQALLESVNRALKQAGSVPHHNERAADAVAPGLTKDWLSRLPPTLQKSAYVYGDEAAWPRADALEAIAALSTLGAIVIGVEVWLKTDGAPRIPMYQWDFDQQGTTDPRRADIDANSAAADYVRSFQWDSRDVGVHGHEPYFNLTLS